MPALILRLPNHLGDACMALPALDLLAAQAGTLTLVGRGWAAELFAAYPWPVLGLPATRAGRIAALRALRRRGTARPDRTEALLLTNSFSSALEFRLAGLPAAGYARDARSLLLRPAVPVARAGSGAPLHTIEYYFHLAQTRLAQAPRPAPAPRLRLAPDAQRRAVAALARAGIATGEVRDPAPASTGGYVVLCPVARGRHQGQNKCWDGFGRLGRQLRAQGIAVVLCPGPGEAAAARAAVPDATVLEALDLGAFGALLAGSRLVVANDSGPGHLAAAVGARLVGVFGVTDPGQTGPRGPDVRLIGSAGRWPDYEEVAALVAAALAPAARGPAP